MRLKSTFQFYRAHFGYERRATPGQSYSFARAIGEFTETLLDAAEALSFGPFSEYGQRPRARQLTLSFLDSFAELCQREYDSPFADLRYVDDEVRLPKQVLGTKELVVPVPYLLADPGNRAIFITFGGAERIEAEMAVLKGLVDHFGTQDEHFPENLRILTYWDVLNCVSRDVESALIVPTDRLALIETAAALIK